MSRAALAEMTGLNKTTVSSLVQELIGQRYLCELGHSAPGSGRPAVLVSLNPSAGFILAAEIDCDQLVVVRSDFGGQITWRGKHGMSENKGQEAAADRLLALLRSACQAGIADQKLLGVALGVPGLVDIASGTLVFAPNLHWENVPLGRILASAFDAPILVDNEANLAAVGEHYLGSAQGCDEVLFISAGIGLGAGILHEGRLCRGATGLAGEVGHMTMNPDGKACACGNRGCWETLAGEGPLLAAVRRAGGTQTTLAAVVAAVADGDTAAIAAIDELGQQLGIGIASLVNALNPELVVIGGRLSSAASLFLPVLRQEVRRRALRWNGSVVRIELAEHGPDACIMGGIASVLQGVLARPGAVLAGQVVGM